MGLGKVRVRVNTVEPQGLGNIPGFRPVILKVGDIAP